MEVEWLILADAAQVTGNKLYLLGGGWDRVTINKNPPVTHRMSLALAFRVPWNETNLKHTFEIEAADSDGNVIGKATGQFEIGRPAGLPPGSDQRTQIAANVGITITKLGTYVITARVDGAAERSFPFYVVAGPTVSMDSGDQSPSK